MQMDLAVYTTLVYLPFWAVSPREAAMSSSVRIHAARGSILE